MGRILIACILGSNQKGPYMRKRHKLTARRGQELVEIAIIVALIVLLMIPMMKVIETALDSRYDSSSSALLDP